MASTHTFLIKMCLTFLVTLNSLFGYERPYQIDEGYWNQLKPYFLPEDHPQAPVLDKLFARSDKTIKSQSSLRNAGYKILAVNKKNGLCVVKHKSLKKKILKIFPKDSDFPNEGFNFLRRVHGSQVIKNHIACRGWGSEFFSPQKYIYPLPLSDDQTRFFVLVVDDVGMAPQLEHEMLWKTPYITQDKLTKLYTLIIEAGMADSVFVDNIPIARDGRIAFIDTEHYHNWGIPWSRLMHYLTKPMSDHWEWLVNCYTPE